MYKTYTMAQIGRDLQPLRENGPGKGIYQIHGIKFDFDQNQGRPILRSEPVFETKENFDLWVRLNTRFGLMEDSGSRTFGRVIPLGKLALPISLPIHSMGQDVMFRLYPDLLDISIATERAIAEFRIAEHAKKTSRGYADTLPERCNGLRGLLEALPHASYFHGYLPEPNTPTWAAHLFEKAEKPAITPSHSHTRSDTRVAIAV